MAPKITSDITKYAAEIIFRKIFMFKEWMQKKIAEGLVDAKFTSTDDFAVDHDEILGELFKTIRTKYPQEMEQFLNGIAQRGDTEVESLLSKLKRPQPNISRPQHHSEKDEIMPANADRGFSDYSAE